MWLENLLADGVNLLETSDIIKLDRALCNKELRSKFANIAEKWLPSVVIKELAAMEHVLHWKTTRNFHIRELIVECHSDSIQSIAWSGFEELQSLTLVWPFSPHDRSQQVSCSLDIPLLSQRLPNLRSLTIQSESHFDTQKLEVKLITGSLEDHAKEWRLQSLQLRRLYFSSEDRANQIKNCFQWIGRHCHEFHSLAVQECFGLTFPTTVQTLPLLPQLQSLEFLEHAENPLLQDDDISAELSGKPCALSTCHLEGLKSGLPAVLKLLDATAPQLTSLALIRLGAFVPTHHDLIVTSLSRLTHLRSVTVQDMFFTDEMFHVLVTQSAASLQAIKCVNLDYFTDDSCYYLAQARAAQLQSLELVGTSEVSDVGASLLCSQSHTWRLTRLRVEGVTKWSLTSYKHLLETFGQLEYLFVDVVYNDEGFDELALFQLILSCASAATLQELVVQGSENSVNLFESAKDVQQRYKAVSQLVWPFQALRKCRINSIILTQAFIDYVQNQHSMQTAHFSGERLCLQKKEVNGCVMTTIKVADFA